MYIELQTEDSNSLDLNFSLDTSTLPLTLNRTRENNSPPEKWNVHECALYIVYTIRQAYTADVCDSRIESFFLKSMNPKLTN